MGLADIFEDYRNFRGRQRWKEGKATEEGDYRANLPPGTTEQAMEFWGGVSPGDTGMAGAIRAWHGSPHRFTAFDLSKRGTGEGAQAFGDGLYFTEAPRVAAGYAPRDPGFEDALARVYDQAVSRQDYAKAEVFERYMLHQSPQEVADYLTSLRGEYPNPDADQLMHLQRMDQAQKVGADLFGRQRKSNLYETDLRWPDTAKEAADPLGYDHLLNWNESLSSQPSSVVDALRGLWAKHGIPEPQDWEPWGEQGGDHYYRIANKLGGREAMSQAMRDVGIPGMRYRDTLDGDAQNFVIFDDSIPSILSRNGKPVR